MTPVIVSVMKPLAFRGKSIAAGEVISTDALGAHELIASGRAALADPADSQRVRDAVIEQRERMLRGLRVAEQQRVADWTLRRRG